jgi:hypothetical protein
MPMPEVKAVEHADRTKDTAPLVVIVFKVSDDLHLEMIDWFRE